MWRVPTSAWLLIFIEQSYFGAETFQAGSAHGKDGYDGAGLYRVLGVLNRMLRTWV